MNPDDVAKPVEKKKFDVGEQAIDALAAGKFAGVGDFQVQTAENTEAVAGISTEGEVVVAAEVAQPKVAPAAVELSAASAKELEARAKQLLNDIGSVKTESSDSSAPVKPKKKVARKTMTIIATALVVTLMGVGSWVGFTVSTNQKGTDPRSQAKADANGEYCCSAADKKLNNDDKPGNDVDCSEDPSCDIVGEKEKCDSCTGQCLFNASKNQFFQKCFNAAGVSCGQKVCDPKQNEKCSPIAVGGCSKLGQKDCQKNLKGLRTGFQCSCDDVDKSATSCETAWVCTSYRPGLCPPEGSSDACLKKGDGTYINNACLSQCTKTGNCLNSLEPTTFYEYHCQGMVNGSGGCQSGALPPKSGKSACFSVPAKFCGWIQLDSANGCFVSKYIPCGNNPNSTPTPTPKPTPTPTPKPTPTPVPTPDIWQCKGISKDKPAPAIGQAVTFTCSSVGTGIKHYEFRYKIGNGAYIWLPMASYGQPTSKPLTIIQSGTCQVQCRACRSGDSTNCTTWGAAK